MFGVLLFLVIFLVPHGARQVAIVAQQLIGKLRKTNLKPEPRSNDALNDQQQEAPHSRRRSSPPLPCSGSALAQKKYDTGATDTEIKIGNIMPYSGPASAYGVIGKTEEAYFKKINAEGGINGRKINFVSYDDGYSPPKARRAGAQAGRERRGAGVVQSARHAVQHARSRNISTAKKVPQLFVATGATKWNDPKDFPGPSAGSPATRAKRASTPSS